jgi:polysaccharide export outer membrane protein
MANTLARVVIAAIFLAAPLVGNTQSVLLSGAPAPTQPVAPPLLIGSGDLIDVTIFDAPELSGRFRADQNGDVQMPLLPNIHLAGLTAEQAAKVIQDSYTQAQILIPEAARSTVFIEEYANQGIAVSGEVKNPGIYPAFGVRMLNDVITAAGGTTPTAASKVLITRRNDPQHSIPADYNPEARSSGVLQVQLYPGDTVVVLRAGIIYVLGDVNKAGGFVLDGHSTLTVEKAMALAGGSARAAAMNRVQIVRTRGDRKEMITVPVDRILEGKAPDMTLQDGDILYVPTSTGKLVTQQAIVSALGVGTSIAIYKTAFQ